MSSPFRELIDMMKKLNKDMQETSERMRESNKKLTEAREKTKANIDKCSQNIRAMTQNMHEMLNNNKLGEPTMNAKEQLKQKLTECGINNVDELLSNYKVEYEGDEEYTLTTNK